MSQIVSELLTTKMLARRWQFSPRTLEGWRYRNEGPPYLIFGRRVLYALSDVEAFEAAMFERKGELTAVTRAPVVMTAARLPTPSVSRGGRSA